MFNREHSVLILYFHYMVPNLMLILEIVATLAGIACVYLQTREKIIAWPFGILSVTLYVYIFFSSKLYSDTILHIIYIALNVYGWWYWSGKKHDEAQKPIKLLKSTTFIGWMIGVLIGTAVWGFAMHKMTDADLVYVDAFTTVGSLCAQFLLARKVLQNWIIWIIVDIVAVNVYIYKGLYFTSFMFFVFLLLCIKGFLDWRKHIRQLQTRSIEANI